MSTEMIRSAERRKCPKCGRKSALVRNAGLAETYCRWNDCNYWVDWQTENEALILVPRGVVDLPVLSL